MTYQAKHFIKALENTGGIIKNAAAAMGCTRQTVYNATQRYPEVAEALEEEREKLKDVVEERLIEQIQQGNMTAIIWYSKTQMRDRGYIERQHYTADLSISPREMSDDELLERTRGYANRIAATTSTNGNGTG